MIRNIVAAACLFLFSGCATPWPDLPPTTYSGTIYNEPLQRNEPSATVRAVRPGKKLGPLDRYWFLEADFADNIIGSTRSDPKGAFVLKTTQGYVSKLVVASWDGRLAGWVDKDLKTDRVGLILKLRPEITCVSYRGVNLGHAEMATVRSACNEIMFDYASTGYTSTSSFSGYLKKSIITPDRFKFLQKMKPHLVGEKAEIRVFWPNLVMKVPSFDAPVEFRPADWRADTLQPKL